jgi:6-phosphogluconolactonase (cycloisomerase 2 family)
VSEEGLGTSVALSADAKTIVASAPYSNNNTGYVVVYTTGEDGGSWTQLGQTIYGIRTDDTFGDSVDISSDGKLLAIGSPGSIYNIHRPGYVQVYTLEISGGLGYMWKQLGQNITGEADGDNFGGSVSLSEDGKTLAIGAEDNDGIAEDSGRVKIYHLDDDGASWEQLGQDIDGETATDRSGYSVSLSADGKTVAIGAPYNSEYGDYSGYVRVYRIDSGGSTWEKLGQTISGDKAKDTFGFSLDISSDGKVLVAGTYGGEYVRVYTLESSEEPGSSWKQLGQNITGEEYGDWFGESVSISMDGKMIAVGGSGNDGKNGVNSGHVRVYRFNDTASIWMKLGDDIDGEAEADYSGSSVSLSSDGKTVAIGSPLGYGESGDGAYPGHVRVFTME